MKKKAVDLTLRQNKYKTFFIQQRIQENIYKKMTDMKRLRLRRVQINIK